jgi:hypothetical protein
MMGREAFWQPSCGSASLQCNGEWVIATNHNICGVAIFEIMNYNTGTIFKAGGLGENFPEELFR